MNKPVEILLVGIGGYGNKYLEALTENYDSGKYILKGAVEPYPEKCRYIDFFNNNNLEIYATLEDFYEQHSADLAVISSPIHYHKSHTLQALENGSNVLCEKPISATINDLQEMINKRDETNNFVTVGFQWSFTDPILNLKSDIMKGKFGKPQQLKTMVQWPRSKDYFSRNSWAGRIKDDQGNFILDSVANNATAHFLHNMFFVLGNKRDRSINIKDVEYELYRANNIENYDTSFLRVRTQQDTEILFLVSHAVPHNKGPIFEYKFEKGTVYYGQEGSNEIKAVTDRGQKINYGNPDEYYFSKLWMALRAVKEEVTLPCSLEAARTQVECINLVQNSGDIKQFTGPEINFNQERNLIWVNKMSDVIDECFAREKLPHELNVPWAVSSGYASIQ
ncbi:MAG: Gfo/Idh/MocA family protein [bacterium]